MMRVSLIVHDPLDTPTGGYLYDRMLVEHLRGEGDEVDVVIVPRAPMERGSADHSIVMERLLSPRPDIVLEDELCHPSLRDLNLELRKEGRAIVSIVHHLTCAALRSEGEREASMGLEGEYLETVDAFVFNSHATRGSVESLLGREVGGVVAPPGRDHMEIIPGSPAPPPPLRLLFVGNVLPHKGLDVLIDAISGLKGVSLDVIGDPGMDHDFVSSLRGMIEGLGLEDRVRLLGRVTGRELRRHYSRDHVLAVPSFCEGWGIVYAEALGHGMPVIAGTAGGAREVARDGLDGFLIGPGDVEALRERIASFRDDAGSWARMRRNALARFQELPTWEGSMRAVRAFLRHIVEDRCNFSYPSDPGDASHI